MPEKESGNLFLQVIPFVFAIALSCLGGVVNYLNKLDRSGAAFSFLRLSIEVITSGFVGIVSFMLCDQAELSWNATAAIVAISGHMGTRALFLIEKVAFIPLLRSYGYGEDNDSKAKTGGKK